MWSAPARSRILAARRHPPIPDHVAANRNLAVHLNFRAFLVGNWMYRLIMASRCTGEQNCCVPHPLQPHGVLRASEASDSSERTSHTSRSYRTCIADHANHIVQTQGLVSCEGYSEHCPSNLCRTFCHEYRQYFATLLSMKCFARFKESRHAGILHSKSPDASSNVWLERASHLA